MSGFFKSLFVTKEDRSELSLTHLQRAGIEYIGERHVGSYDRIQHLI